MLPKRARSTGRGVATVSTSPDSSMCSSAGDDLEHENGLGLYDKLNWFDTSRSTSVWSTGTFSSSSSISSPRPLLSAVPSTDETDDGVFGVGGVDDGDIDDGDDDKSFDIDESIIDLHSSLGRACSDSSNFSGHQSIFEQNYDDLFRLEQGLLEGDHVGDLGASYGFSIFEQQPKILSSNICSDFVGGHQGEHLGVGVGVGVGVGIKEISQIEAGDAYGQSKRKRKAPNSRDETTSVPVNGDRSEQHERFVTYNLFNVCLLIYFFFFINLCV